MVLIIMLLAVLIFLSGCFVFFLKQFRDSSAKVHADLKKMCEYQEAIRAALEKLAGDDFVKSAVKLAAAREEGKQVLWNSDRDSIIGFEDPRFV